MTKEDEKDYLRTMLDSKTSEVIQVADGHVFMFTKKDLVSLVARLGSAEKAVVFVRHRVNKDIN
jgi:hypothetical protein